MWHSTLELKDIGLFDLTMMRVIKNSEYLYRDVYFRANLMKRIKKNFRVLSNAVEDLSRGLLGSFRIK